VQKLTIAVATGPSGGLSLENEIRLVKPALLYADRVSIISPVATLLQAAEDVGASEGLTMALFRQLGPELDPVAADAFAHFDELRSKPRPSRSEARQIADFRRLLQHGADEILEKAREMMLAAGAGELAPALDAGLVAIEPVVQESDAVATVAPGIAAAAGVGTDYDSLLANSFMQRIRELLADPFAYPLFDEQVGDIVRAHVSEGLFEVGAVPRRHGKHVSAAAQSMEKLPSFPSASVQEVLEIRNELQKPLTNFRAAVAEMERILQSAAYETDFPAEVEDLYLEKVAPALQEIGELVRQNSYLRELMRAAVGDAKSMLTAVLTVGVAALAGIPDLVAAALAAGIPTGAAALRANSATGEAQRDIEAHHLFFLYKTEELLQSD
jgi:hypothetical protein